LRRRDRVYPCPKGGQQIVVWINEENPTIQFKRVVLNVGFTVANPNYILPHRGSWNEICGYGHKALHYGYNII
jgi:hypothetical protein